MKRRRVVWAEVARHDLEGIVSHAAADSQETALEVLERLERRAAALSTVSEHRQVIPELGRLHLRQYRAQVVEPFHLIYRIAAGKVLVLAVVDGRRSLEDVLLERLIAFSEDEEPD